MVIGLLSACTVDSFRGLLATNSARPIKCTSSNNRPRQARTTFVDINYPWSICSSICPEQSKKYKCKSI